MLDTYRELRAPLSVQIEVVEACNNNCFHCYNHFREQGTHNSLHVLDAVKMQKIVKEIIDNEIFSVTITGGEPLLNFSVVVEAINMLCDADVEVGLNSNLTLLTKEMAETLKSAGLFGVLTSLHADVPNIHDKISCRFGAFDDTVRGIKVAMAAGIEVTSNMVLLRENIDRIEQTAYFLSKELGVRSFAATKASPALNSRNFEKHLISRDEVRQSLETLDKIGNERGMNVNILECYPLCLIQDAQRFDVFASRNCSAGITACSIGANGLVRPCSHCDDAYGNIFEESLSVIWQKMSDWRERRYLPQECQSCQYSYRCNGGCRMEAKYHGDVCGRDPYMSCPGDVLPENSELDSCDYPPGLHGFEILPGTMLRKESFGGIVHRGSSTAMLDEDGFLLFQALAGEELKNIAFQVDSRERISSLISYLENKKILVRKRGVLCRY